MIEENFEMVRDQMGPCGVVCGACDLGNGTVASTARKTKEYLQNYGVSQWAPLVPGGDELDFDELYKSLDWVSTYTACLGCERGGGPPDCSIRRCARERGYGICSECPNVEECDSFQWLGEHGKALRKKLKDSGGKTKKELINEALEAIM